MLTLSGSLILAVSPALLSHSAEVAQGVAISAAAPVSAQEGYGDKSPPAEQKPPITPASEIPATSEPLTTPIAAPPPLITPDPIPSGKAASGERAGHSDIVILGRRETAGDPLSVVNVEAFQLTQTFDEALVGPAAKSYRKILPSPVRKGIRNFLYNLREPVVFLNFMLQLKPGKAAETVGRFAINSTVGAAGLVDVAKKKPFHLPRRSNGFANTLGYYGVGNGPFLFLPIIGPTTVRDLFGGTIDRLLLPAAVGSPFNSMSYTAPAGILGALDHRSEFDKTLKALHDNSPDPYAATRAFYLNRRQAEIDQLRGRAVGDPTGMTGAPSSVVPFVPAKLAPQSVSAPPIEQTSPENPVTSEVSTPEAKAEIVQDYQAQ